MDNPINVLNKNDIVAQGNLVNITDEQGSSGKLNVPQMHEHPAIFLMKRLSETVMQIYKDMGLGQHIDFDV